MPSRVQLLDLFTVPRRCPCTGVPVDAQGVVGPVQHALVAATRTGSDRRVRQLPDPFTGRGNRNSRSNRMANRTWRRPAPRPWLQGRGLAVGVQVAAQLLQAHIQHGMRCLDHEGSKRKVAVAVGPVVHEVPGTRTSAASVLVVSGASRRPAADPGRAVSWLRCRPSGSAALAVGEDAPEHRGLAHRDGFGNRTGMGVVPGGEGDDPDGDEGLVVRPRPEVADPPGQTVAR